MVYDVCPKCGSDDIVIEEMDSGAKRLVCYNCFHVKHDDSAIIKNFDDMYEKIKEAYRR